MQHRITAIAHIVDLVRAIRHRLHGLLAFRNRGDFAEVRQVLDRRQTQRGQDRVADQRQHQQHNQSGRRNPRNTDDTPESRPAAARRVVKYKGALHVATHFIRSTESPNGAVSY